MFTHAEDMETVHFQPAAKTAVCGAKGRVVDRVDSGEVPARDEQGRHTLLMMKTTTDVRRVTCEHCRVWLRDVVRSWNRK